MNVKKQILSCVLAKQYLRPNALQHGYESVLLVYTNDLLPGGLTFMVDGSLLLYGNLVHRVASVTWRRGGVAVQDWVFSAIVCHEHVDDPPVCVSGIRFR